ncbi:putative transcriptional regulatory protein YesN [Heyndrickxia oleronia]|nr:putative transcriptional regulatory protein YesN [Heyndrickxia oleronia]
MIKILLADDEWIIREGLKFSIPWKEFGLQLIGAAANGKEAIEMVKNEKPDILITDIRMPGVSGLELIELVQKEHSRIKTVILTGYSEFSYAQQAIKLGINDFLLKPLKEAELTTVIKKLIQEIELENKEKDETLKFHLMNFIRGNQEIPSTYLQHIKRNWANFSIISWESAKQNTIPEQLVLLKECNIHQIFIGKKEGEFIAYTIDNQENFVKEINHMFKQFCLFGGASKIQQDIELIPMMYKQSLIAKERCKSEKEPGCVFIESQNHAFNIDTVLEYLKEHYMEPISLQEIAAKLFISDSYFSRMFKQYTGKKYIDYVTELRIKKAKELLAFTSLKTNEISRLVGYTDQRYFSQIFKKNTGLTPSEYKNTYDQIV